MAIPILVLLCFVPYSFAQDPVRPYPLRDAYLSSTSVLDHSSYVNSFDDPQWYLDNIPFVDFPDKSVQDVYYYRASVIKRHLKFGHEGHGWVFTEFIHPVAWASKLQTIPDSAPHHMVEGRWLRDPQYVKDLVTLYTRGGVEALSGVSYTHYVQRAALEYAQATGDKSFIQAQLDGMIYTYNLWSGQYNNDTGLYHRIPLSDAQEYSLPGYLVGGPNGGPVEQWNSFDNDFTTIWLGPETYRPSFNSYMVANAKAIADVARLAGNSSVAQQWDGIASDLFSSMRDLLWDDDLKFWIDVIAGTLEKAVGRQLIGYFPYRFEVGTSDEDVTGLEAGLTPEAFLTGFGPTTLEKTNPYYTEFKNTTYCCVWQGQSWPFSTSVYLGTLARMARSKRSELVTPEFFYEAFINYTNTNYANDHATPYTAESHYPTADIWSGDTTNHSEHYLHSTYFDNVFTNLVGIVPTLDDRLELQPLIPEDWTHFAIENLPYHGSLFTLLWDKAGTQYPGFNHSKGLSVYANGRLLHNQATLSAVNITLGNSTHAAVDKLASQPRYENILVNPNSPWGLPSVTADYQLSTNGDIAPYQAWKMNDGLLWYDTTPDNRWTNNQSTTPYNVIEINLPRARKMSSISLAIYDDTARKGVIACPEAIRVTNKAGDVLAERSPWRGCRPNALNTVLFSKPSVNIFNTTTPATGYETETDYLKIVLSNQRSYAVAVTEIQIWVPANEGPRYEVEVGLLGTFIGSFEGTKSGMNSTIENGGVTLHSGAWAEVADVCRRDGKGGPTQLTLVGGGTGSLKVRTNFLTDTITVDFAGEANKTVEVEFLEGGNVVTLFQARGNPWVDAIVVGSE